MADITNPIKLALIILLILLPLLLFTYACLRVVLLHIEGRNPRIRDIAHRAKFHHILMITLYTECRECRLARAGAVNNQHPARHRESVHSAHSLEGDIELPVYHENASSVNLYPNRPPPAYVP